VVGADIWGGISSYKALVGVSLPEELQPQPKAGCHGRFYFAVLFLFVSWVTGFRALQRCPVSVHATGGSILRFYLLNLFSQEEKIFSAMFFWPYNRSIHPIAPINHGHTFMYISYIGTSMYLLWDLAKYPLAIIKMLPRLRKIKCKKRTDAILAGVRIKYLRRNRYSEIFFMSF